MADSRASATLTVEIVASCVTDTARAHSIQLELDDDLNGGNTCFTTNTPVYIMLFPSPYSLDFSVDISYGTIESNQADDGFVRYTEYVTISDGEGSSSKPIHTLESYEWIGRAPCPISQLQFDTSGYKFFKCNVCSGSPECGDSCEVVNGVLKITYLSLFKSYVINVPAAETVVITAYEDLSVDCT